MAIDVGSTRAGEWMQTYSGNKFWPSDPRPDEIHIGDIAASLSKMCRFGGHCLNFYSVAEHSVHCARHVAEPFRLAALLHDASEAYIVDIPRPIKPSLSGYYEIESGIMGVIAAKYGFQWPLPPEVKHVDNSILRDEREQNMAGMNVISSVWGDPLPGLGVELQFWDPDQAKEMFLDEFHECGGRS
jgi:hypothetical protein